MTQSIHKRFFVSLVSNLLKSALSFLSGLLVARGLGPENYGIMVFMLGTFVAFRQLFDLGSSSAFFTFISRQKRSVNFLFWYLIWLIIQFLAPLIVVGVLFPNNWLGLIWHGGERSTVLLAFIAVYMQSTLWSNVANLGESQRITFHVQVIWIVVLLIHVIILSFAYVAQLIEVEFVLRLTSIEWFFASIYLGSKIYMQKTASGTDTAGSVIREFRAYCTPLILYSFLSFFYDFTDRWLLQAYAGSSQQAYFSIANQFGSVIGIVTTSVASIFWKEVAELHHLDKPETISILYSRFSRSLFFITAAGAGFLAPWAEEILYFTLGDKYLDGRLALSIMFYYPISQSLGVVGNILALSTGMTSTQARVGTVFMILSIVISYFLLAPTGNIIPGFGYGAVGLALKMVLMGLVFTNMSAYLYTRKLGLKFEVRYQLFGIIGCTLAGLFAHKFSTVFFDVKSSFVGTVSFSILLYLSMLLVLLIKSPFFLGLKEDDIEYLFSIGRKFLMR